MDAESRRFVRTRANHRCEYCGIHQRLYRDFAFHITSSILSGLDPESGELTRLFHPRTDHWSDHFEMAANGQLIGLTDVGRTTVHVLNMNSEIRTRIRQEMATLGEE